MKKSKIILGKSQEILEERIGFQKGDRSKSVKETELNFDGTSHMMTIAPTGSGKFRNCIAPIMLTYEGPIIALDVKGEITHVVKRRREEMGHKVIILDPFKETRFKSHQINPFDICKLKGFEIEDSAQELTSVFSSGNEGTREPFWDNIAKNLCSALISYIFITKAARDRNFASLKNLLSGDVSYDLATLLDCNPELPKNVKSAIAGYLSLPDGTTRPCVDQTLTSYFNGLNSTNIDNFLSRTTFDLNDIVEGKNLDIFLIIPPAKLNSHNSLVKLLFSVFSKAILSRQVIPHNRTLMILDECSALGNFKLLETLVALCRGYGVCVHTLWQDLSQLRSNYPSSYESLLNNCAVWQLFGSFNHRNAKELSNFIGLSYDKIMGLKQNEQILQVNSDIYDRAKLFNYLTDPEFKGHFDKNPFHSGPMGV